MFDNRNRVNNGECPTTNGGMQSGSSVRIQYHYKHVFSVPVSR